MSGVDPELRDQLDEQAGATSEAERTADLAMAGIGEDGRAPLEADDPPVEVSHPEETPE